MAKSIRSKRMKKLRAIKRARNGPRETKRLKRILGLLKPEEDEEKKCYKFADVRDLVLNKPTVNQASGTVYDLRFVPDRDKIQPAVATPEDSIKDDDDAENKSVDGSEKVESMEADNKAKPKIKGLKNEHGNYPIWMSHRRIRKIARKGRLNKYKLKRAGAGKTF